MSAIAGTGGGSTPCDELQLFTEIDVIYTKVKNPGICR